MRTNSNKEKSHFGVFRTNEDQWVMICVSFCIESKIILKIGFNQPGAFFALEHGCFALCVVW